MLLVVLLLSALHCSLAQPCPNNCTDHGTCQGEKCACNFPWAGPDCSQWSVVLPSDGTVIDVPCLVGVSQTLSLTIGASSSPSRALTVSVVCGEATLCPQVYMAEGYVPTPMVFSQWLNSSTQHPTYWTRLHPSPG